MAWPLLYQPAQAEVTIPYELPTSVNTAKMVFADVLTGRILREQLLRKAALRLDLAQLASVCYAYTLIIDGKPVATKKIVVILLIQYNKPTVKTKSFVVRGCSSFS